MKKILALLLLILAGSVGMKAQTTFISDLCVINAETKNDTTTVLSYARSQGWKILLNSNNKPADFSENAGSPSWYIYIGYKTTTDYSKSIKQVKARKSMTAPSGWNIVPACLGSGKVGTNNLNQGKGTAIYLFTTKASTEGSAALTSLNRIGPGGKNTTAAYVKDHDTNENMDFLVGTGSKDYIYLELIYHQHTFAYKKIDGASCQRYCTKCSYAGPAVNHNFTSYTPNIDGLTHQATCSNCGYKDVIVHHFTAFTDNRNGTTHQATCSDCGYKKAVAHRFTLHTANNDGTTHHSTCSDCGALSTNEAHTYSDAYTYKDDEHCARSCTVCGHQKVASHIPGEWTANSGITGAHSTRCQLCKTSLTQNHEYVWTPNNEYTCALLCKVCHKNKNNGSSDHTRVYHDDAVEATCTAYGKTATWHCARCSYEGKSESVKPLGHSLGATVTGVPATCVSEGQKSYSVCTRCEVLFCNGSPTTEEGLIIPVNPAAHDYSRVSEKPSTCTESGYSSHYRCTLCEKYFYSSNQTVELSADDIFIPPHVSTSNIQMRIEPTCTVKGILKHYLCRTCGKRFLRDGKVMTEITDNQKYIPALGHDLKTIPAMATSGGTYAAHEQCRRCYEFICPDDPLRNSTDFSGVLAGSGTEADPYLITSQNDLHVMAVRYDLTRNPPFDARKTQRYFRIARDFTISGTYLPVGFRALEQAHYGGTIFNTAPFFSDILDGASHTVTFDQATLDPATVNGGFIGSFGRDLGNSASSQAIIRNVIVDGELTAAENTVFVGGICGSGNGSYSAEVINCHNHATLHFNSTATKKVAGIVGGSSSSISIVGCSNHADLLLDTEDTSFPALAGITTNSNASVSNCCNTGSVTLEASSQSTLGGISTSSNVWNCRNTGNLTFRSPKRTDSRIYGIAVEARNCYNGGNITIDETSPGAYPTRSIYAVSETADADAPNYFSGAVSAPLVSNTTSDPAGTCIAVTLTDGRVDDATIGALNTWVGTNNTDTRRYNLWTRGDDGLPVFSCETGDLNNDGVVSVGDSTTLIDILRGVYTTTPRWSDVNNDGHTDIDDLKAITDSILD